MSEPAAAAAAGRRATTDRRRSQGDSRAAAAGDEVVPERRKYTRRATPVSPPYFEVFERIAVALERIAQQLEQREVRLPDTPLRPRPRSSAERR